MRKYALAFLCVFLLSTNVFAFRIGRPPKLTKKLEGNQITQLSDFLDKVWQLQQGEFNFDIVTSSKTNADNGDMWLRTPPIANIEYKVNDVVYRTVGGQANDTDYISISSNGTMTFNGEATVWDDLRVPLSSIKRLGFSDPDWVQFKDNGAASVGVYAPAFDNSTDEEVFFSVQLPHSYKEGTDIIPHVHWAPSDANSGGVTWGLEYTWANINAAYGATTIITADDATDSTSHKQHIVNFTALTGTGKTLSSMLMCRLFRDISDANDNYGSDAFLLEIDFHFEIDSVGSDETLSK